VSSITLRMVSVSLTSAHLKIWMHNDDNDDDDDDDDDDVYEMIISRRYVTRSPSY